MNILRFQIRFPAALPDRLTRARLRRIASQGTAILAAVAAVSGFTWAAPSAGPAAARVTWSRAAEIRLPANASADPGAVLVSVTCTAAGFCLGGGGYKDSSANDQSMVVTESHGRWARARELQLPPDTTTQPFSEVTSVACTSARSCVAVGSYQYAALEDHGFIAAESNGRWARAFAPRLPLNADTSLGSGLDGAACTGPGWCVALGLYTDKAHRFEPMVVTEVKGRWGRAAEIAMPVNSAPNPDAFPVALACPRRGYCAATGSYTVSSGASEGLGMTESRGRWQRAVEIKAPSNANGQDTLVNSVACIKAGSCVAVGRYEINPHRFGAIAVTDSNGNWGRPRLITAVPPGAPNGSVPEVDGISCPTAASCLAVGGYAPSGAKSLAMAVIRSTGSWRPATEIRLPANAGAGPLQNGFLYSVACATAGHCFAVGYYADSSAHLEPMAAASR